MGDVTMTEAEEEDFQLSGVFEASSADIKGIAISGINEIIVGGRQEVLKFFAKRGGEYVNFNNIQQPHGQIINSLAIYETNDEYLIFAGRKDGSIAIYNNKFVQLKVLTNHKMNVCVLHVDAVHKKLLSGSWDNSVIIWPIEHLSFPTFNAFQLKDHTLSVWALATFKDKEDISLSGSADHTIKLWKNDNCIRTYLGHIDVVRALQVVSNEIFVSAANDCTYRIWHVDSVQSLHVVKSYAEDFIFGLSIVGNYLVSCGDNGMIEVWKMSATDSGLDLKYKTALKTPAGSNWCIKPLDQKEFAVGASDGRVYLYSTDPERKAADEIINAMNNLLSEKMAAEILRKEQMKNEEIVIKVSLDDSDQGLELRYKKGSDPALAAENFIKANNLPLTYLDEIINYICTNIPEAQEARNKSFKKQPTQKVFVDGEYYDYAMEVTLSNKKIQLPFNVGDDPNSAALRFCEKHNIEIKYVPQFANLIRTELQALPGTNRAQEFYDPFTGGNRYLPNSSTTTDSSFADPFTGSGRYVPGSATSSSNVSAAGDPFTSGGRYIPGNANSNLIPNASRPADRLRPRCELVPVAAYYFFDDVNPKMFDKLKETNNKQTTYQMNPEQLSSLETLLKSKPNAIDVGNLEKSALGLGLSWPFEDVGIIFDFLRYAVLHDELNKYFFDVKGRGIEMRELLFGVLVSNPEIPVKVFVCRTLANCFAHEYGRDMMMANFTPLLERLITDFITYPSVGPSKHLHMAAASVFANWSYLLLQNSEKIAELGPREDILRAIINGLEKIQSFGNYNDITKTRLLQAIVTLMWGDKQVIQTAKSRDIVSIVNRLKDAVEDEASKNIARCVVEMTHTV